MGRSNKPQNFKLQTSNSKLFTNVDRFLNANETGNDAYCYHIYPDVFKAW